MSRIKQNRERVTFPIDHAAVTATTTIKGYKVPTGKSFLLDRVSYINPTGLVADNTNAFAGTVQNASVVAATLFNTDGNDVVPGASLAADTFVEGTLATALPDRWFDAGEIVSLVLTEDGTATLPAGRLVVEGYLY